MNLSKLSCTLIILFLVLLSLFSVLLYFSYFNSISRVSTDEKVVFLTFDDGPSLNTLEVLRIITERNISATFFLIGDNVLAYPDAVNQLRKDNVGIGTHSMTHSYLYTNISGEIFTSKTLLENKFNRSIYLFRPPYGFSTPFLADKVDDLGLKMILWDVFPKDYKSSSVEILQNINDNVREGSIIVLHDGPGNRSEMLDSLDEMITVVEEKGFKFALLEDYIGEE